MLGIRLFGNKILLSPTRPVRFDSGEDIQAMVDVMMATLTKGGGVGIAANQCEDIPSPVPSLFIVGVPDEETRAKAQLRYPGIEIPDAKVLINAQIVERSTETYFPPLGEGCLSVPCSFRGRVKRHEWVRIQYYDIQGKVHEELLTGLLAHIAQHETDHLQGLVFMQHLLGEMSTTQREHFNALIDEILDNPSSADEIPKVPTMVIDRNDQGELQIHDENLKKTFSALDPSVLKALKETP